MDLGYSSLSMKRRRKNQFSHTFTFFIEQKHTGQTADRTVRRAMTAGRVACAFVSSQGCRAEDPRMAADGITPDFCLLKLTKKTGLYSVKCVLAHNASVLCAAFYPRDHSNGITNGANYLKIRLVVVTIFKKTLLI